MVKMKILVLYKVICGLLFLNMIYGNTYYGYKVYEVIAHSTTQAYLLQQFSEDVKYDFWQKGRTLGKSNLIMVSREDQPFFEAELTKHGLNFKVNVLDVGKILQQENIERRLLKTSLRTGDVTFSNFMFYTEQMAYVRRIARDYPAITRLETIGQSYEGRDILLLRISSGPSQTPTAKPMIFIDAGIHCREWIAPPVALYIIHQLVENNTNSAFYRNVDWAIVPNLNPDGYEYTQNTDRLWRKNRRLTEGASCYGTDLNRNFNYSWMFAGASNNPCTQTYAGPEPFSEPEAQAIRNWLVLNKQNIHLYLTIHSFGEYLLYPWGYAPEYPNNSEELQSLGNLAAKAIEEASTIGSSYFVGNSASSLGPAAGASDDWVKSEGVELSYTVELPNTGAPFNFMIPARHILPVVKETWAGIQIFHGYIEEKFWTNMTFLIGENPYFRNV